MRFLLIASLFSFGMLAADQALYQTQFSTVKDYLDRFEEDLSSVSDEILICTLRRSGTNLTMAMLNQLTGKDCLWSRFESLWHKGVIFNRTKVKTDSHAFPILGSHYRGDFSELRENKLIVTLRDYKEYFCRKGRLQYSKESIQNYLLHLKFFDNWDFDKKLLVRYEDLIDDPSKVMINLTKFLGTPESKVSELQENYNLFKRLVFDSYLFYPGGTKNDGLSSDFHQKKTSRKKLLQLEDAIKKENPYLFAKYLRRYKLARH